MINQQGASIDRRINPTTTEAASGMNDESQTTQTVKPDEEPAATENSPQNASESAATPAPEAPASEATDQNGAADAKPSDRIRIGTQREGEAEKVEVDLKPNPVMKVSDNVESAKPGKSYPPPNVRQELSEEEQAEFDAIVGDAAVDAVLDSSAAAAPEELAADTKLKGKVASVTADSVILDLGSHRQGVVPLKQFEPKASPVAPAPAKPEEKPKGEAKPEEATTDKDTKSHAPEIGAELDVVVVRLNSDEGIYDLSLPTASVDVGNWDEVSVGQTVDITITGKNKGGLECTVSGIRGFMPMGQISVYRVENPEEYVGQKLTAVITEANRSKKNLILSHRAIMERERAAKRDQLLQELAPGQLRDGVVRSLRDFGAFVDLGGVDGMVHVSKLSWDRVNHPKDVLSEGQQIKVKVEKVDRETGKIALSYREAAANPWDTAEADYPVGSTVKGKVSKIMDFDGFVRLGPGVEGLIHISELDYKRVNRTADVLSEGQEVEAKVLSVDRSKQRIALSLKALKAAPVKEEKTADEDLSLPKDAPRKPRRKDKNLKGGIGGPSGGEQFGLKW